MKGLAIIAFGTTYEDTYKKTIKLIIEEVEEMYPDLAFKTGLSSRIIQRILRDERDINIPLEKEVVEEFRNEGVTDIYLQPLHLLAGHEYEKMKIEGTQLGSPLFESQEDVKNFAEKISFKAGPKEAYVLMGHGSDHEADWVYPYLQKEYEGKGEKVFVGTVEGERKIWDIIPELKDSGVEKVYLQPLMLVAGDHAHNDMASEDEGGWKRVLKDQGFDVEVIMKGLGEYEEVRNIYYQKIENLLKGEANV